MIFVRGTGIERVTIYRFTSHHRLFWPWLREPIRSKNTTLFYSSTRPHFRAKTDLSDLQCCDWFSLLPPTPSTRSFIKSHKRSQRKMETSWFFRLRFEFEVGLVIRCVGRFDLVKRAFQFRLQLHCFDAIQLKPGAHLAENFSQSCPADIGYF